ncbi:adenylate/guanylate cyclase domain-containing protein [Roseibium sediminis]|uniref:adenylate/guanylate cyclase domain-containing protein n=1 Tax=Roseibium sediminis TaxID=1775174 RepID=UPI00123DB10F|nr:adenylate/guanylate cyclase domain-containing protein [Roseibium sediminis]
MIDMKEIDGIEDWLIGQALQTVSLPDIFASMCERLNECGVQVDRATLGWSTLHPLIEAEMVYWTAGNGAVHERYTHREDEGEDWINSPMRAVLHSGEDMLRRKLRGANSVHDYPLCEQLSKDGYADYVVLATGFDLPALQDMRGKTGILVSWATIAEEGFSDEELFAIQYLQKRFALAARATLQAEIAQTIADTYLGCIASRKVLSGQIRHGDGENISAVIFFSDIRNSTSIAEALGPKDYLRWLNIYFDATAGAVLHQGGEILDFIGDAVLAVFPISEHGLDAAVRKAIAATDEARHKLAAINSERGDQPELRAGIALSVGDVMFGNIGIPDRLTFSVIGQTVHAAARIEALNKTTGTDILVTEDIARLAMERSRFVGKFALSGFSTEQPLYTI